MKLPVAALAIVFAPILHADPSPEEQAFCTVKGATAVENKRHDFPREKLPPGLVRELGKYYWSGGDDPDYLHNYQGFTLDLNRDDQPEYFIHSPYASGSGGWTYEVFNLIGGNWKHIGGYQGLLWTIPSDEGWMGLVSVGRGGGGHWTKVFSEFKDGNYEVTRLVRFDNGKVTEEKPQTKDQQDVPDQSAATVDSKPE